MKEDNKLPGINSKIFTITLNESWNTNFLVRKYKIISQIRETDEGFEYDIEEV